MRPKVGFATVALLEAAGCEVVVPEDQTCCGQPAWNAGDAPGAAALAKRVIALFEPYEYVVVPSGSCADQIRNEYREIFSDAPAWRARAEALAPKVFELTDFLVSVCGMTGVPGRFAGSATYHDSCTGLRSLGIKAQPRQLLAGVEGLELREMAGRTSEECCGFGGLFSIKFGEVSAAIADRKCEHACDTGADAVIGGDLGCLLNIEGRLRRRGDDRTRVLHVAEVLSGHAGGKKS